MSFEAIEVDWLVDMCESSPLPWRESLVMMYLRYAEKSVRRRVRYWVPERCCAQVRGCGVRSEMPGRRGLAEISGCGEKTARRLLADRVLWIDGHKRHKEEDDTDLGPGLVPGSSRVRSRVGPGLADENAAPSVQVGPGLVPSSIPGSSRVGPDRAITPRASTDHRSPENHGGSARETGSPVQSGEGPPEILRPDGRPLPEDLADLLGEASLLPAARALARNGIDTPARLLAMSEEDLRHTPGVGGAWRRIAEACTERGFPVGCLSPPSARDSPSSHAVDDLLPPLPLV